MTYCVTTYKGHRFNELLNVRRSGRTVLVLYSSDISISGAIVLNLIHGGYMYRVSSTGEGGRGGSFPPKNFMYINDVIQEMVSN